MFLIIILVIFNIWVSKRENMEEFNNSLANVDNIEKYQINEKNL